MPYTVKGCTDIMCLLTWLLQWPVECNGPIHVARVPSPYSGQWSVMALDRWPECHHPAVAQEMHEIEAPTTVTGEGSHLTGNTLHYT